LEDKQETILDCLDKRDEAEKQLWAETIRQKRKGTQTSLTADALNGQSRRNSCPCGVPTGPA